MSTQNTHPLPKQFFKSALLPKLSQYVSTQVKNRLPVKEIKIQQIGKIQLTLAASPIVINSLLLR